MTGLNKDEKSVVERIFINGLKNKVSLRTFNSSVRTAT